MSVLLHELGHSEQGLDKIKYIATPEARYKIEQDAWNKGVQRAKMLGVWSRIDKNIFEIQRGVSLLSYRQIIKMQVNYIH